MQLYDTAQRRIVPLKPLKSGEIKLYTCGPTVYSHPHIGNWSANVRWDILVRTLKALNISVDWVMNLTDVGHLTDDADEGEDKMEKGARREGKTAWEVAAYYTTDFEEGMRALNMEQPTHLLKATDHIAEQIALIEQLEKKGFTYIIDDGVYFDTAKFPTYGKLADLQIQALKAGARVAFNEQKKNITDFALWKFTPKDVIRDMEWQSPWGKGFPGWHIECSAMAMAYLGETLDIHAGGIDHIPVHHTNEIAQSEAATGKQFANLWLHCNFITVDGTKLSKSLGNSYTLQDIYERGFSADDLRMLFLQSHYRTEADFSWETLLASRNRLLRWLAAADVQFQASDDAPRRDGSFFSTTIADVLECLQDDLDTPQALAIADRFLQDVDKRGLHVADRAQFITTLTSLESLLGLSGLTNRKDVTVAQKTLIIERETARKEKDFARADDIRSLLQDDHVLVRDTTFGSRWSREEN